MGVETTVGISAAAASEPIVVRGARVHNLQNVDVEIPSGCLVVVTGVSGSGKSSLAFDTVYAEGQRRYVESLSAYARQFLERMDKPLVDEVRGVCPAIAIQQRVPPRNSRSTVGTVTEIQDYLRLLFARAGTTICPCCGNVVHADTPGEVAEWLLSEYAERRTMILFPRLVPKDNGARLGLLQHLLKSGFRRLLVDGVVCELVPRQLAKLATNLQGENVDVIVDRLRMRQPSRERLLDSVGVAFREGDGRARAWIEKDDGSELRSFDDRYRCADCDRDFLPLEPRLFSFNNPYGACPECKGFGNIIEIDLGKVIPDPRRSLADGAVEPWNKQSRHRIRSSMRAFAVDRGVPLDVAWADLEPEQREAILDGGDKFIGVHGFFARLRKKQHKLHVRVLLARYRGYVECPACEGTRLRADAHAVQVDRRTMPELSCLSIGELAVFFDDLELPAYAAVVVEQVLREIRARLRYLVEVGLDYVTLDRLTGTLSGGEAQRISLATCLGSMLVGSMYVLDEPSVGLHPRDNERLISILARLRDLGNTVLVVEHDRQMIEGADHLIDMGPGAGVLGGRVVFAGAPSKICKATESVTSAYLSGHRRVPMPALRRLPVHELRVIGARQHNLKNIDVTFPLGVLCCVTGVSGSGKSTLIHDILHAGLLRHLGEWKGVVGDHDDIEGAGLIRQAVLVDQAPIGRSARSNPVTYVKAFDPIRKRFATTREARARGYGPGHFSFNVAGGRCEACQGAGQILVEMQFLPDVNLPCEECGGTRFRRETLDICVRGKNIHDVLQLTVGEARRFFADLSKAESRLKALEDVGLGYLRLGQPSSTLSGGEAQRVKLASHLLQGGGKGMLYLFDEPTTGLHFDDIAKLLFALNRLIDTGASAIVIEHNLDLIKAADWVIDLGPEGGDGGGSLVTVGTPEEVATCSRSHTARYLRDVVDDDL